MMHGQGMYGSMHGMQHHLPGHTTGGRQAMGDGEGEVTIVRDKLNRPRTVFAPGHRIRMNIIPLFLNLFGPWFFFVFVSMIATFHLRHESPWVAFIVLGLCWLIWLVTFFIAARAKRRNPEPTWFTYFSLMMFWAVAVGTFFGSYNYSRNLNPYYNLNDLKVISHLDPGKERGQNVMDAGIFYFSEGTHVDGLKSWHFKHDTLYCVAPIVSARGSPETQSYDFWAVGKDCCSMSSSDFRCGDTSNPTSRSAIRIFDDADIQNYRLAVEQTETLYNVMATHPIFFEWYIDPLEHVSSWNDKGYKWFLRSIAAFFVLCLVSLTAAVSQFAYIGRRESVYEQGVMEAPNPPVRVPGLHPHASMMQH